MSMNNKQRWMGGVVLLGGGVLLAALLVKGTQELQHKQASHSAQAETAQQQKNAQKSGTMQALQPLTVDVETEKRLLEEQKRGRERAVAEQEARTQQYLQQQQQVEAEAARKAADEYAALNKHRAGQDSSDNIPPAEVKTDSKTATDAQHSADSTAKKKLADDEAAKHQASVDAKKKADAEAKRQADLEAKKQAELDAKKQAEDDRREAAAKKKAELEAQKKADAEAKRKADAEAKRKAEAEEKRKADADAKHQAALDAKKKEAKKEDADKARDLLEGKKKWMVQVSLAANQANADATVSKLRAKGYKVVTSPTSKGIRIMVGPSKDREGADTARRKIQSDASLGMKSAWVIDWVPLDQR